MKTKFKLNKSHLQGAVAMFVVCALVVSGIAISGGGGFLLGNLSAQSSDPENIKYKRDSEGKRTGVISVKTGDITYYDINGGDRPPKEQSSYEFYKGILTKPYAAGKIESPINLWAQLAYNILWDQASWTGHKVSWHSGTGNSGGPNGSHGQFDIVHELQQVSSGSRGTRGDHITAWTGLQSATSLADVRYTMAGEIAKGIDGATTGSRILDMTTDEGKVNHKNALGMLNNSTKRDVLYTITTGIVKSGLQYSYRSYGLAFYDFELTPVIDQNLDYISAFDEGDYSSFEDAASRNERVTYSLNKASDPKVMFEINKQPNYITPQSWFEVIETSTTTNSITNTQSYTFGESVNAEGKAKVPFVAEGKWSVTLNFSQMIQTSDSHSTSQSTSTKRQLTTSVPMPPHTAFAFRNSLDKIVMEFEYDCPVTVSYKVAVFNLCGDIHDDDTSTIYKTVNYWQKHFCTIFGNVTGSAAGDLKDRAIINASNSNHEKNIGATYGRRTERKTSGCDFSMTYGLNWGFIKDNTPVSGMISGEIAGNNLIERLTKYQPMAAFGGKYREEAESLTDQANDFEPLYPLHKIENTAGHKEIVYNLIEGDKMTLYLADLGLMGTNGMVDDKGNPVRYYGFNPRYGNFILLDKDYNQMSTGGGIVTFSTDPVTGTVSVKAGSVEGEVYLKYVIDEDKYTYMGSNAFTKNSDLADTFYIKIDVKLAPLGTKEQVDEPPYDDDIPPDGSFSHDSEDLPDSEQPPDSTDPPDSALPPEEEQEEGEEPPEED